MPKYIIQSVIIPIDKFTKAKADSWMKSHTSFFSQKLKAEGEKEANFYRYRQRDPNYLAKKYLKYKVITKEIKEGIKFIFYLV